VVFLHPLRQSDTNVMIRTRVDVEHFGISY